MKGIGTKNVSICEDWMIFLNLNSIILLSNKYNFIVANEKAKMTNLHRSSTSCCLG